MPELPDLAIFKRYLDATALHRKIAHVAVHETRIVAGSTAKALAKRLAGRRFEATDRRGKYLFVRLDDGGWAVFHFGMTGFFAAYEDEADEPRHSRVRFDFADGGHLSYVNRRLLGEIRAVEDRDAFAAAKKLGSDALGEELDEETFRRLFSGKRGAVKGALMDQSLLAGIGNIFADEILFQAGLHPKTPLSALDARAIGALYRVMRRVLETAVERGAGSERLVDRLPRGWLLPRRAENETCPRCGAGLKTVKVSGRTSYYCPECQAGG